MVECLRLVVFSVSWLLAGPTRTGGFDQFMITMSSVAFGIQSSAAQRFGVSGLSSTYLTGTLTAIVAGFVVDAALVIQSENEGSMVETARS